MSARAVVVERYGDPDSFALKPRDPGTPGPGKIAIRVHAAGVSYVDVLAAEGLHQMKPPLPFVPGSEFAGVIEAVGEGVDPARIGERVMASGFGAAFSEAAVIPAKLAHAIPETMDFATASIFRVSYATAWHALVQRSSLKAGETVLVLGAGGAVGYAAVEIAKALGARVIASASSPEKRDLALRGGADAVVDSRSSTWRDDVKAANDGKPVDIVVDPLGGDATEPAFRSLAWNGRHLVIGFAAGHIPKLPINLALLKGASLIGVDIRQFGLYEPERHEEVLPALFGLYRQGHLHPPIAQRYPLEQFAAAMKDAKGGRLAGRVVLDMAS
ncbi:NADPH:quinone oxidoreductase family protein [Sphingobium sp. Sx8-8]|uniref:NADPH:quinone oxidoreductase family protein n=1 Tax=Sphingobium sp. Sx8-8 TaxID=2933617 RepID=UPI001F5AE1FD|nr:NADPH:quinone oxidoreductase family protein [Sphingobium sp. Sx8-8]